MLPPFRPFKDRPVKRAPLMRLRSHAPREVDTSESAEVQGSTPKLKSIAKDPTPRSRPAGGVVIEC
ncbi:MAG: hypothetical protein ACFCUN_12905 [Hyphomicrobiaceae bacterium]